MNRKISWIVLSCVGLSGCVDIPAEAQPDNTVFEERLRLLGDLAAEQTAAIVDHGRILTDVRFDALKTDVIAFKTEVKDEIAKIKDSQAANHREVVQELRDIKRGQAMPWTVAMIMAGVGSVGGVGGVQLVQRTLKKKPEDDPDASQT